MLSERPLDDIFASSQTQLHFTVYLITFSTFLFRSKSSSSLHLPPQLALGFCIFSFRLSEGKTTATLYFPNAEGA